MSTGILTRLRDQSGVAVPIATTVLSIMLVFAGIASSSAVWVTSDSSRDRESKRALAAAEGALDSALERLNSRDAGAGVATDQCVGASGAPTYLPIGEEWCNVVNEPGQLNGQSTSKYRISELQTISGVPVRKVVAIGTSGQRSRVLTANLRPVGNPIFALAAVALDLIVIDSGTNGDARIIGPEIGTNGDLRINGANSRLCGSAIAKELVPASADPTNFTCPPVGDPDRPNPLPACGAAGPSCFTALDPDVGYAVPPPVPTATPASRPAAPMKNASIDQAVRSAGANIPSNSDCIPAPPPGPATDGTTANNGGSTNNIVWDCEERRLTLRGNAWLSLAAGEYLFCELQIEGSAELRVPNGNEVQIWMDNPTANPDGDCPNVGTRPFKLQGGGHGIVNDNRGPAGELLPSRLALNGLGSRRLVASQDNCNNNNPTAGFWANTNTTAAQISPATEVRLPIVVNMPAWCVKIGNEPASDVRTVVDGAVIAQILRVQGKGRLVWNEDATTSSPGQQPVYVRVQNWRECSPVANAAASTDFTDVTCP